MLLKNKFYMSFIILLIILDIFLIYNVQIVSTSIGNKLIYSILFIIFLLVFIGVSVRRK
ncbi:Uncharacterised protein [Staphylococcus devriesei]|nr:Uncharacterised protein [Staphylococcus devriesei]